MHNPKSFTALLVALGLVVCSGGNSLLMGGQTDLPHQTHLHFLRGPGMGGNGSPCWNCHTSGSAQALVMLIGVPANPATAPVELLMVFKWPRTTGVAASMKPAPSL